MNNLTKKILTGLVAGTFLFAGVGNVSAERIDRPAQHQEQDLNALAKKISTKYEVSEKEVLSALQDRRDLEDIRQAAFLAKASGKSFKQVLSMKSDWRDVRKNLKVTDEKFESVKQEFFLKDLAEKSDLDTATLKKLLEENYHPHDISTAGRLAKVSGREVREVLDMKKINNTWAEVAEQLGVEKNLIRPDGNDRPPIPQR